MGNNRFFETFPIIISIIINYLRIIDLNIRKDAYNIKNVIKEEIKADPKVRSSLIMNCIVQRIIRNI